MANPAKGTRRRRHGAASQRLRPTEKSALVLLAEQKSIPTDQVGRLLGTSRRQAEELLAALVARGLVETEQLVAAEPAWWWLTYPGAIASGLGFAPRKPRLVGLAHLRAINEARLMVEERAVPGLEWVCERRVRREHGKVLRGAVPDAVVKVDGKRHAIEAELSRKEEGALDEKIEVLEGRFDLVVYFVAPDIGRYFERIGLAARHPKLAVREVAVASRRLTRPEWRVPGDPAPGGRGRLGAVRLAKGDRRALVLLAEQKAIPMDQLGEYLGESTDQVEARVRRYLEACLVRRAQPVPGEAPWVWLGSRGMREVGYELASSPPRLGGLERQRAVNEVRLLVEGGGDARWVSGRLLRRGRQPGVSPPDAVVEVGGKRHAVEVWTSAPEPRILRQYLARRSVEYDVVAWFYSRKTCAAMKRFAQECGDPKLVLRAIPKADLSGLRVRSEGRCGRRARTYEGQTEGERTEALWQRLLAAPPVAVRPVVVESVAEEALDAIASASGGRRPRLRAAWRRPGKGMRLYRLETDLGVYRVIRSGWGWRATLVRHEEVFELLGGEPVDPRQPRKPPRRRYVPVEPRRLEFSDEVWCEVRELIPPIAERPRFAGGRESLPDKVMLSCLVWMVRTETPFNRMEEVGEYGSRGPARTRLRYWEGLGVWKPVCERLTELLPDGAELNWNFVAPRGAPEAPRRVGG